MRNQLQQVRRGRRPPPVAQDRPSTHRGANQARQHDLIANGLGVLADATAREDELAAALEPALLAAAHEVLCDTEINGPLGELAQAIATESTAAVVKLLRDRESGADLGSIISALRSGITAAQALAAMSAALDELMPAEGWRPRGDDDPLHNAHAHLKDARRGLALAQAFLVGCPEVA